MKLATSLLVPAVVLGLAACGSSDSSTTSSNPSSSSAEIKPVIAPIKQTPEQAKALRKATEQVAKQGAKPGDSAARKTDVTPRKPATAPESRLPKQTTAFAVGSGGVSMIAPSVQAGAPFRVALASVDGRVHKVTVDTPAPRTVTVPSSGGTVVKFPSVAAGKYALSVDGKHFKPTLAVVSPRD
jgi:hypothetical protein